MSRWLDRIYDPKTGKRRFTNRLKFVVSNVAYVFLGICFLVFSFLLIFVSSWLGFEPMSAMLFSVVSVLIFGFVGAVVIKSYQNRHASPPYMTMKKNKKKEVPHIPDGTNLTLTEDEIRKRMKIGLEKNRREKSGGKNE